MAYAFQTAFIPLLTNTYSPASLSQTLPGSWGRISIQNEQCFPLAVFPYPHSSGKPVGLPYSVGLTC